MTGSVNVSALHYLLFNYTACFAPLLDTIDIPRSIPGSIAFPVMQLLAVGVKLTPREAYLGYAKRFMIPVN